MAYMADMRYGRHWRTRMYERLLDESVAPEEATIRGRLGEETARTAKRLTAMERRLHGGR